MPGTVKGSDAQVNAIRQFNRVYFYKMGFLSNGIRGPLSLTEVRILHELVSGEGRTSTEISAVLHLDPGFLSRVLTRFEKNGYITRERMLHDGRQRKLGMTAKGRKVYGAWVKASEGFIRGVLDRLAPDEQRKMIAALETVLDLLGETSGRGI